ncbi:MAG TPA: hypothetical protein VD738_00575 [Nitrospira sp.]|jgi:hypothetical protein|nr:hypothetical protein [Nitrospira sp.]
MHPTSSTSNGTIGVRAQLVRPCTHGRVVDEVRDASGIKTGRLICLECHAEFPDPDYETPHH